MKFFLCLLTASLFFTGCMKSDTGCSLQQSNAVAPTAEQQALEQYLDTNGITATKHASGFYYRIIEPGTGSTPELCSTITVAYVGKTTNNTQFDASTSQEFILGNLILGWQKSLVMLKPGGRMMLYLPPSLGYGRDDLKDRQGNIVLPGNSILIFDITLNNIR